MEAIIKSNIMIQILIILNFADTCHNMFTIAITIIIITIAGIINSVIVFSITIIIEIRAKGISFEHTRFKKHIRNYKWP